MTLPQIFVVAVVLIPLVFVALDRLRIDVAALTIAITLGIAQALGMEVLGGANAPHDAIDAIAGFSQPVVITLFSLFIITRSLDKTGVTRWIARHVLAIGGESERRLIVLFVAATALLSLFMNNLAAGALLLPSAMDVARRTGVKPSKLLIPVAYGSLLGGVATYLTTANIIVSDLLTTANPPQAPLHILDFTPTGGLILLAGIAFMWLFGPRLLPDRAPHPGHVNNRPTGSELEEAYQLGERLWEARIPADSRFIGKPLEEIDAFARLGIAVAAIWRGRHTFFAPEPEEVLQPGDVLIIVGREERVSQLAEVGIEPVPEDENSHISARGVALVEVLPAPHSAVVGKTLKEMELRKRYGFTAVALQRDRSYRTDVSEMPLKMGDTILMVGAHDRINELQHSPDLIVLEPDRSDQPIDRKRAALSVVILVTAISAAILGFPVYLAMLTAAVVVFLTRLITIEEAYHAMEWQAIFLIAGMYSASLAMVNTGLAELVGHQVVAIVTPFGPLGLAAGVYLLTAVLTQIMGGQVTALVTGPIAISAALKLGTSPQAMAVATAIGCSASFFTPLAHPVNILMMGPGNYTFSDFFHIGWRLTVVCFVVLLIGMALFWGV